MFSEKWHYRFMEVARLIATWSKDPNTKTGAIVVGPDREIRATGYNGLVRGVNDDIPERMERPASFHLSKVRGWSARPNTIFSNTRKETRFTTRV